MTKTRWHCLESVPYFKDATHIGWNYDQNKHENSQQMFTTKVIG